MDGVYILETEGPEFRVAQIEDISKLCFNDSTKIYSTDPTLHLQNARGFWKGAPVFLTKESALKYSAKLQQEIKSNKAPQQIKLSGRF